MDFGQRGVILRLGEVRSFIRKPYIHSYGVGNDLQDTEKAPLSRSNQLGRSVRGFVYCVAIAVALFSCLPTVRLPRDSNVYPFLPPGPFL